MLLLQLQMNPTPDKESVIERIVSKNLQWKCIDSKVLINFYSNLTISVGIQYGAQPVWADDYLYNRNSYLMLKIWYFILFCW